MYCLKRVQTGIDGSFEQTTSDHCHQGKPVLLQVEHESRGTERRVLDRLITNSCGSSLSSFEYHCGNFKNDLNRTYYMSYRLEFLLGTFRSLEYSSGITAISGDPDLTDDSVFDDHGMLLSLLQGVVSLKTSVAVKPNSDLSSEALPDESGEDQVLLLHTNTCQNGQIQNTVDGVGGDESVKNAWQSIQQDLKLECGLTFTVESRKAERACVNMTSILIYWY